MTDEAVNELGIDLDTADWEEVIKLLAKTNKPEYNTLKLSEELAEAQEKVIKFHLKTPEKKPSLQEVVDELGDVFLRIAIFLEQHELYDMFEERLETKGEKLLKYYKEDKYKGGI